MSQENAPVTVDIRALVDKVLARYPGEFTVFRELLQNSDDAGCDTVEICFETAAFLGRVHEGGVDSSQPVLDARTTNVIQWKFRNHGKPFRPEDWSRLTKIAAGNPDPHKIGAFGVGFYSVFSVTDHPSVSSGGHEIEFYWNDANQLYYRPGKLPSTATSHDMWTTFKLPLREVSLMPPVLKFVQFLASAITFMVHLKKMTVFFDDHPVGHINKSQGPSQPVVIPAELSTSSPGSNIMVVTSVRRHAITIDARFASSLNAGDVRTHQRLSGSTQMHESKVDLTLFTAEVDVATDDKLSEDLNRCTKKNPPRHLKYSLVYTEKAQDDQSRRKDQKNPREPPSLLKGFHIDLDGATHARIFIGHATAQTTGIGGHMASYFIPTVERESIDLVEKSVAIWNRALLYVGGFLCRVVYELELSKIQNMWEEAVSSSVGARLSQETQDGLNNHFLHVLEFFTFRSSTPSWKVSNILSTSFYGCSKLPPRFLSSSGVRRTLEVREFDPVFATFLRSLPMLAEKITREGAQFIATLPDQQKIPAITLSDVLQDLRVHTLEPKELVACLRWWITSQQNDLMSNTADMISSVTFRTVEGTIHRLSSVTHFIPNGFGSHVPLDGPLPSTLFPFDFSKYFLPEELAGFGWKEFTAVPWLQYISHRDVAFAHPEYDFTRSADWAGRVLSTLSHLWPQFSDDIRCESREILRDNSCIPTSKGLCSPGSSFLPLADNSLFHHLDLPTVGCDSSFKVDEDMRVLLLFIGVRKNIPVRLLLQQMLSKGNWTVFNLVDYLVQAEPSLTDEDILALTSSRMFAREGTQCSEGGNVRYRADELYPPIAIFRRLRLPVVDWWGKSEWREESPEAQLLYRLGLNQYPPLSKIVDLCASNDAGVQDTAFGYLCNKLHSQYLDYDPGDFRDLEFIPAEGKGYTCWKKLGEVYSSSQWRALGFFVVPDRYQSAPLHRLGVNQHPSAEKLVGLLEKTPPPEQETAIQWFEVLFDHIASFSPPDLIRLSGLPVVPIASSSALKFLPPTKCYLDQSAKPALYAKLFVFVNFGAKANRFLGACGSKDKVSIEDVAEALIDNPNEFFKLAGGYEGFLVELRKFAYQSQDISNDTLHKMSHKPTLLGVRRKKTEDQHPWDYEYQFGTHQDVIIVDDFDDYQLFSDTLFVAPQEEALERFYASLGCSPLSAAVEETYDLQGVQATKRCLEVQSLILERLPMFINKYIDVKPKFPIPSCSDHLTVKACGRIHASKTLRVADKIVKRTRDVLAIARSDGACIQLWLSTRAKPDMYEVSASLCRLLFGTNKMNATLLFETILSADMEVLERRGFIVDPIPQKQKNGHCLGGKGRKKHSAVPSPTVNSAQQPAQDASGDPDWKLPGRPKAPTQSLSLAQAVDSLLTKTREVSNVPGHQSSDMIGNSTSLLPSRPSRDVIPQRCIRENVEKAIKACTSEGEISPSGTHAGVGEFLSSGFCRLSADIGNLRAVGQVKNIAIYIAEGSPDTDTFMERMRGPLTRFVDIIIPLSEVYHISTPTLRVFYDVSGGCIAFNRRGILYLNLRYFEVWHDEQVRSGNRQNAQISWFLALAHEIAHNLTELHNSDHEFWSSAICEAHLVAFSQLLRPTTTWLRYSQPLWIIAISFLFAHFVSRLAQVTSTPNHSSIA